MTELQSAQKSTTANQQVAIQKKETGSTGIMLQDNRPGVSTSPEYKNPGNSVAIQKKQSNIRGRILQDNRAESAPNPIQRKPNNTGLPDNLKSGMESVSGMSLDQVKVHYNSPKPATVQAHAYAQGNDIHLASGQEKHLPHELGHVVQQMQGKVQPTTSVGGVAVNDNPSLEKEADVMGEQALQLKSKASADAEVPHHRPAARPTQRKLKTGDSSIIVQRKLALDYHTTITHKYGKYAGDISAVYDGPKDIVGLSMEAELNPHQPVKGSATDKQNTPMYSALWKSNGIVRGHLLNHDLGGLGVPQNLFPITSGANSRHSAQVEQPIKKLLRQSKKDTEDENNGVWYTVKVMGNNTDSGFHCQWGLLSENLTGDVVKQPALKTVPIKSNFTPGTKSDPYAFAGREASLPAWHHGKRHGNADGLTLGGTDISKLDPDAADPPSFHYSPGEHSQVNFEPHAEDENLDDAGATGGVEFDSQYDWVYDKVSVLAEAYGIPEDWMVTWLEENHNDVVRWFTQVSGRLTRGKFLEITSKIAQAMKQEYQEDDD